MKPTPFELELLKALLPPKREPLQPNPEIEAAAEAKRERRRRSNLRNAGAKESKLAEGS